MKIATVRAIPLEIPFTHGGKPFGWGGQVWTRLSILLVRVETESGLVGYGEAFSYTCRRAVQAVVEDMIAPLAVGSDANDIVSLNQRLQRELHLQGRHGLTIFALSGLDIALWDIAGKAAGLPLHRLLGAASGKSVPGCASLYRYGDREVVVERCLAATGQGYRWIKLHEIAEREVAAAREALGNDEAPDFTAETTQGTINFHEWIGGGWAVLFSQSQGFHTGVHNGARLYGGPQARVRQAQRQDHGPQRRFHRRPDEQKLGHLVRRPLGEIQVLDVPYSVFGHRHTKPSLATCSTPSGPNPQMVTSASSVNRPL